MRMAARSKRSEENEEESVTLAEEDNSVLDFCLKRDSYDSGLSFTPSITLQSES